MRRPEEQDVTVATNPILAGFFPDPSICRVGEAFYLVNSTFECFPVCPFIAARIWSIGSW